LEIALLIKSNQESRYRGKIQMRYERTTHKHSRSEGAGADRDEIMTVTMLARYLRCHPSTIYRLLKSNSIPAFKIGSDWRFQKSTIERWLRRATIDPTGT
jgi:excisionase family DNA binding protein